MDLEEMRSKSERFAERNLAVCAAELIDWQNNSVLCHGRVRELAALCAAWVGERDALKIAERMVERAALKACAVWPKSNENEATATPLAEHPAVTSLRAIHDQPNCRYEVEAQLGQEVFYPLSMDNEYGDMMKLAAEIRDLIFDEGDGTMQGAMIGSPVECLAFAKWWIQRAKGVKPDQDWFAKPEGGGNKLVEALRTISGQDPVEMALDPQWAARVSRIALTECGYKA